MRGAHRVDGDSHLAEPLWVLLTCPGSFFFTLSAATLKPGLRNSAAASGEHLPQRSKGKTSINQHISTSVPVHKGAEIGLWSLCNCSVYKEKRENKSVG